MITYYRLLIQYKGTHYLGWQVQAEGAGHTVQGELNKALQNISKSSEVKSMGSGRTDAGVHALGQVVKIQIPLNLAPEKLVRALNAHLPEDIRVLNAELSDEAFMPTVHAKSKEYQYRFTCSKTTSAFQNELIANCSFDLDLALMKQACQIFVGEHDFSNFYCEGTEVSSNIREIFECDVYEVSQNPGELLPNHYVFRVVGSGFLKQMVRLMVGALWNIGRGKITLEELNRSLGPVKGEKLGPVAPPEGLYMVRVNY